MVAQLRERAGRGPELPTGIESLDAITQGVWKRQLTVIAGRPGDGKTSLALQIAGALADRRKAVVFVSYEMTREELVTRLFASHTRQNLRDVGMMIAQGPELDRRLEAFRTAMQGQALQIVDDLPRDWKHLKEFLELLDPVPDAVFIDHLQEVSTVGFRSSWDAYTEYVAAMKWLAKKLRIAVILCSQLSRPDKGEDEGKRPQLRDLKGTGAIEEKADTVVLLWPTKDRRTGEWQPTLKLLVEKQRHGPTGACDVLFNREHYVFAG